MAGNVEAVTAVPARTPAPSTPVAARPAPASDPLGKKLAAAGQGLPPEPPPEAVTVEKIARRLNELMAERQRNLHFHVDEASGRTVITVRQTGTNQVVRQIPSEEVLALARLFEDTGVLLDEQI